MNKDYKSLKFFAVMRFMWVFIIFSVLASIMFGCLAYSRFTDWQYFLWFCIFGGLALVVCLIDILVLRIKQVMKSE